MSEQYYIGLIYKRLTEKLSQDESNELEEWLSASEEHRDMAKEVAHIWERSKAYEIQEPALDLDEEFARLEPHLDIQEEFRTHSRSSAFNFRILKIAASITILALIGFAITHYSQAPQQLEIVSEENEQKRLRLPDGTNITLKGNSKLIYPATFRGKSREIYLEGEAFLEVAHLDGQNFAVNTSAAKVSVLGTEFIVKDLPAQDRVEVSVLSGKVSMEASQSQQTLVLEANDVGILYKQQQTLRKEQENKTNTTSWYTKSFIFEDTPMEEVIQTLNESYGIDLKLENEALADCPFNLILQTENYQDFLNLFSEVYGIESIYTDDKQILLKGGSCSD